MPKAMRPEEKKRIEESVLPKNEVGKYRWPITVQAGEAEAKLRLIRDKKRIVLDWLVPERFQGVLGQARITRQIRAPEGESVRTALLWARADLSDRWYEAEKAIREGPVTEAGLINDVSLSTVLDRFAASEKYRAKRREAPKTADQWDLWMDFLRAILGGHWTWNLMSPDVLSKLHAAYQEPWARVLRDGSTKRMDTGAGNNSAAKVIRFVKTLSMWALAEPNGRGRYLLETDPFQRIRSTDMPREHESEARSVGVAGDEYVNQMYRVSHLVGENGQFRPLFAGEATVGRRSKEWRVLRRLQLLTDLASIREALEDQRCRRVLPDNHIPDNELDRAAEAYFELSGAAIRFMEGKQAAADPTGAAQYDRVVPLGPWTGPIFLEYLREYWEPLGLDPCAPLFPAATDPTEPTAKDTVIGSWWTRAEVKVAAANPGIRIPNGRTHTLRRRVRNKLQDQPSKTVAFYAGWTLRQPGAMDRSYLSVTWQDVVRIAKVADERLSCET